MSGIDGSNIEKCHNSLVFIYFERGNFSRDDFAEDTIHEISLQRTANSEQKISVTSRAVCCFLFSWYYIRVSAINCGSPESRVDPAFGGIPQYAVTISLVFYAALKNYRYAPESVMSGVDIMTVKELLGHNLNK